MSKGAQENDHLLDAVALLVLDVQERLLPVMADGEAFTDRVAFALEAARIFNIRVIFTEQVPEKLGPTLPSLRRLAPNARVFRKSSFSALQANGLQDYLRELNIYHLLVCGLETPVCIYQTALQAVDLDLDTTLLSDCLASRRPEDDAFILPSLTRSGTHILPAETVFYSMLADATHPRFRAFSDLVKRHDALRRGEALPPPRPEPNRTPTARSTPPEESAAPNIELDAPGTPVAVERSEAPVSPPPSEDSRPARTKRGRGRKRKPPAAGDNATPVDESTRGASEETAEAASGPETTPPRSSGPQASGEAAKKPRRRRRGPRKPKSEAGGDRSDESRAAKGDRPKDDF
ncbi:MAG: isochorismatase family protein [Opitutaceae bacterium]